MAYGSRPSPSIVSILQAIAGGVIGFIQSLLSNPYIPQQTATGMVYGALPAMAPTDIASVIQMAQEQKAAAAAFGTPDVYRMPKLSEIPICPGCPTNKVEATIRVKLTDPTQLDANGDPVVFSHGVIGCVESHIPTFADLQSCAESFADYIAENFYPGRGGYQFEWEVISAQRGTFFGK